MRHCRKTKVAVIGGAGFLGSHLTDHLIEDRECDVLVIDNLVAGQREFVHKDARFIHHDITSSESALRKILDGVKYVYNYAAYPYIPVSFARPIHVCDVNFMGAMKVINAAQEAGCEGILQVSSAEIYGEGYTDRDGNLSKERISEDATVSPHSSYGVAKAAIDNWIQCRWKEAATPCIALRQFNCVGPRETHPYIVPEIISQLAAKGPAYGGQVAHGDPIPKVHLGNNSTRDFMDARTAVRMAVSLLERGKFGEVYNLGSENCVKMYDLAKLIGEVMGFKDVEVVLDPARVRPWEIWHLQSDNAKINSVVGERTWSDLPLQDSLQDTITWFNNHDRCWPWEK